MTIATTNRANPSRRHSFRGLQYPTPPAVLVYRKPPLAAGAGVVSYTGTADATISASRSGHTSLLLYASLFGVGTAAHRERVAASRATAAYAVKALQRIKVDARRHPHAFTVYFPPPPPALTERWVVPADDRHGHIVCMPQVTREHIDRFTADFKKALHPSIKVPRPRAGRRLLTATSTGGGPAP